MASDCDHLITRIMRADGYTRHEAEQIVDYLDREGELTYTHHGSRTVRRQSQINPEELAKIYHCVRVAA